MPFTTPLLSIGKLLLVGKLSFVRKLHVFSDDQPDAFRVRGRDLLRAARPVIGESDRDRLSIGRHSFHAYDLCTPAEFAAPPPSAWPVTEALLGLRSRSSGESREGDHRRIQREGGEARRRLDQELDVLVRYRHPNFDAALLRLAHYYPMARVKGGDQHLDGGAWGRLIKQSPKVAAATLKLLKCLPEDEPAVRRQLLTVLSTSKPALEAGVAGIALELVDALGHLRVALLADACDADPWLVQLGANENLPWLRDYLGDAELGLPLTTAAGVPAPQPIGRTDFAAVFCHYHAALTGVQQLLRTKALHGPLLAHLFSKCAAHGLGLSAPAEVLFGSCIDRPGRTPHVSLEMRRRQQELVQEALDDRDVHPDLGDDTFWEWLRNLNRLQVLEALIHESAFTRRALVRHLRRLWIKASQLCGGAAGRILQQQRDLQQRMRGLYFRLLSATPKRGKDVTVAFLEGEALKVARRDDLSEEFIALVFARAEAVGADSGEPARRAVREAFVICLATESDRLLEEAYLRDRSEIERQATSSDLAYMLSTMPWLDAEDDVPGVAAVVTSDVLERIDTVPTDADPARREEITECARRFLAAESTPTQVTVPLPAVLGATLAEGAEVKVLCGAAGAARSIGTLRREGERLDVRAASPDVAGDLGREDTYLVLPDGEPLVDEQGSPRSLVSLDVRGLESLQGLGLEGASLDEVTAEFDKVPRGLADQITTYVSDSSEAMTEALRSTLRALVLGEQILAAPRNRVSIDVPDLSQALGVLLTTVEHLDARDPDLYLPGPSPATTERLQGMDLSPFWPVGGPADVERVMQFTYDLCLGVRSVESFLREIEDDLMGILDAVGGDSEVVVVDATLSEVDSEPSTASKFYCGVGSAPVVYLTHQAFDRGPGAPTPEEQLLAFATNLVRQCERHEVRLPLLVCPFQVACDELPLPVIDPSTFQLPALVAGEPGFNKTPTEATLVENARTINPYLMLAASFASPRADLGRIAFPHLPRAVGADPARVQGQVSDRAREEWEARLGVEPTGGTRLASLYHAAWERASSVPGPLAEIAVTTLYNAALIELRRQRRQSGSSLRLAKDFGALVHKALQGSALEEACAGLPGWVRGQVLALQARDANTWRSVSEPGSSALTSQLSLSLPGQRIELPTRTWRRRFLEVLAPAQAGHAPEAQEEVA